MKSKKISLFLLVLLVVSAIDSVRNLPSAALFGSSLPFFFLLSTCVFLLPVAMVSAQLSSWIDGKGGVYHWITEAFGDRVGMLGIWLQWINTVVWYPTILSFMAGTLAYLIDPSLAEDKPYLICVILTAFWLLTILNLFGVQMSAKINSIFALIGTMIPLCFLIILGGIWLFSGGTSEISFSSYSIFPRFSSMDDWVSLTVIMASFLGMELAGVHANDIENPQINFPKAMGYASFLLIFTMLFGALTIAMVVPIDDISLVAGVMQVFDDFFLSFGMPFLSPILALLILIGSFGSIINWLISPARGLFDAAECGFLPKMFTKKNAYGVPQNMLLTQAVFVSLLCLVFLLVPGINAFYWFLTALSTDLYMLMYLLLFMSCLSLQKRFRGSKQKFSMPGKETGIWAASLLGIFGCFLTIFISFFPPASIEMPLSYYALLIFLGNVLLSLPVLGFYAYRTTQKKSIQDRHL